MASNPVKKEAAVFTVCSANYLEKAMAMCLSLLSHDPQVDVLVVLVDTKRAVTVENSRIRIVWAQDLGFPDFLQCAFKYNIIELNTALKPFIARWILRHYAKVVYLDPDVCVFASLRAVLDGLAQAATLFTPHALSPYPGAGRPSDLDLLRFGSFNLGFFAANDSKDADDLLAWWHDQCLESCFYEPQMGLGVDQKWIDLAPAFFGGVGILKDVGMNVAFWNLHERHISLRDGVWRVNGDAPLVFVHFSSFADADRTIVAGKQTRYPPGAREDFAAAGDVYRERLRSVKGMVKCATDYGFACFSNGRSIAPTLRRVFAALQETKFKDCVDPFSADGPVYAFAKRHGLLSRRPAFIAHQTFREVDGYRRERRVIAVVFRLLLRLLGPDRYFSLMRYFAHYSSILNQTDMFRG